MVRERNNERWKACKHQVTRGLQVPYVHNIRTRVHGRRASARFYRDLSPWPGVRRVHQLDGHSCGFLSALVVGQYFEPSLTARQVLDAIPKGWQPSPQWGISAHKLTRTLDKLGIDAQYKERLGWGKLHRLTEKGHPVIVSVQPEWYAVDHWTVIRRMKDHPRGVLLSNYDWLDSDGSISWYSFRSIWSPLGVGLVCRKP